MGTAEDDRGTGDELPVLMMRAAKAMLVRAQELSAADPQAPDTKMTMVHGFALRYLARHEGVTATELAHHLGVTRQSASELVATVEEVGYVQRRPHPDDRRAQLLELTPYGQEQLAASRRRWEQITDEWAAVVGPGGLDGIREAIEAYLDHDLAARAREPEPEDPEA